MSIRNTAIVAVVAFLLGGLVAFGLERSRRTEETGRARVLQEQADSLADVVNVVRAREDSVIATSRAKTDTLVRVVRVATTRVDTIVEAVVVAAGADSAVARRAATEVRDSIYLYVVGPLWGVHAQDSVTIAAQARKIDALEPALAASIAEADAWEAAQPGWLTRNGKWLAAGTFALGFYLGGR